MQQCNKHKNAFHFIINHEVCLLAQYMCTIKIVLVLVRADLPKLHLLDVGTRKYFRHQRGRDSRDWKTEQKVDRMCGGSELGVLNWGTEAEDRHIVSNGGELWRQPKPACVSMPNK